MSDLLQYPDGGTLYRCLERGHLMRDNAVCEHSAAYSFIFGMFRTPLHEPVGTLAEYLGLDATKAWNLGTIAYVVRGLCSADGTLFKGESALIGIHAYRMLLDVAEDWLRMKGER